MSCECFITKKFNQSSLEVIARARKIVEDYLNDGLDLTLRQLYYQFVSRNWLKNEDRQYKRLGDIINNARLAGLLDWEAIVDRTREFEENSHWGTPNDILRSAARSYAIDKWEGQDARCEVWIEKDALVGVLEQPCRELDVGYLSTRGYCSVSVLKLAAERLSSYFDDGCSEVIVFHLSDHDPSGVDMTRDIQERLNLLSYNAGIEVRRIALTMDQIDEYNPPPNFAKLSDKRAQAYINQYGDESWELDALEPRVLRALIRDSIVSIRDDELWEGKVELERRQKSGLNRIAARGIEDSEVDEEEDDVETDE